jgi:hypothetical protein
MSQDQTVKKQLDELNQPKPGNAGHLVLMISIISGTALGVIIAVLCLWWGGIYAICSCLVIAVCTAGAGHQFGVGRGYRLAKPLQRASLNEDEWK